tara:strand:+ start:1028 stop:1180 length:153 start_codon:yes stop_codon:yes gene_type:complete
MIPKRFYDRDALIMHSSVVVLALILQSYNGFPFFAFIFGYLLCLLWVGGR